MPAASDDRRSSEDEVPIIDLSKAPGERAAWDKPKLVVYMWAAVELLFVTNPWQISSNLRVRALRLFGADIGDGVIFRPRTRVKFPWKLRIGDRSWIGEGVWLHNQDAITIGSDVVISQESLITTGSHAHKSDMRLVTSPIHIFPGVWITSRVIITGGVTIGRSSLITPGSVVQTNVTSNRIFSGNPGVVTGIRFPLGTNGREIE